MKSKISFIAILMIFCMAFSVSAQLSKEEKKEMKALAKELKKNPEQMKAMVDENESLKSSVASLTAEVENLKGQLSNKNAEIAAAKAEAQEAKAMAEAQRQRANEMAKKAKEANNSEPAALDESGTWFKVQVGAFENIDMSEYFKNNPNFSGEDTEEGLQRITLGRFRDYWEADKFKKALRQMGVKEAWIVPYKDGVRVPLKEVLENLTAKPQGAGN
ncbi:Ezrin/radixin/moesin family protein [Marivirga arenosa]|uniref:Ezrin/radixin/moesin family protein n=1 Tax=Marivirga arenosa TaxID=3059076 RepID=A0AA49GEH3_9BACT|nr:Ezrin/radixin/moesin family protein [Marivirga sp. ABR2-2]WKK86310.2 Ezrin/radixin/moesin family protein [Marivirga sp. ABR2-2]